MHFRFYFTINGLEKIIYSKTQVERFLCKVLFVKAVSDIQGVNLTKTMKIPIRAHTLNRTRGLIGKDWDEYKYGIRRSYFHINASPRRFVVDITDT